MRILILVLILAAAGIAGLSRESTAVMSNSCRDQADGEVFLSVVRSIASDPDGQDVRDSLALPTLADSLVQLVTSDSICAIAALKYTTQRGDSVANRSVWVVAYGPDFFAVTDPTAHYGEWTDLQFYTKTWVFHADGIF